MGPVLTTAPTAEPISLEEAKEHLRRADYTDDDAYISGLIVTARRYAEGFQRRAYITQTWTLYLDRFPWGDEAIELPFPPLQSVTSVKYTDTAAVETTVDAADYVVDTAGLPGRIVPAYGKSWPTTTLKSANGVAIVYKAGYGVDGGAVPETIRQAILLLIGQWYEHREPVAEGSMGKVPMTADTLLWQDRVL